MSQKIKLSKGKFALVDDADYELLSRLPWMAGFGFKDHYYAYKFTRLENGNQVRSYLHHCIAGKPLHGLVTDHINGDTLDNRRSNLRIVTQRENNCNHSKFRNGTKTSQYTGVHWNKHDRRWKAKIKYKGTQFYLGAFKDEKKASLAYLAARIEIDKKEALSAWEKAEEVLA